MARSGPDAILVSMRTLSHLLFLLGIGGALSLIAWQGFGDVARLIVHAGPLILTLGLFMGLEVVLLALAWRLVYPPERVPRISYLLGAMWIGEAVNALLPVATIGGEVAKIHVLSRWHAPLSSSMASVIVDKTVQAAVVLVLALVSIPVLLELGAENALVRGSAVGFGLLAAGIVVFFALQRIGLFGFVGRFTVGLAGWIKRLRLDEGGDALDAEVRTIYAARRRVALAFLIRFSAVIVLSAELWLAAMLLGYPVGFGEAVILKLLVTALRGALFVVPGGFGVQEGGFIAAGALLDLPAEFTLALSLATRVRQVTAGVPALLFWQQLEGRVLARSRTCGRS